jgi:hypothetical protein
MYILILQYYDILLKEENIFEIFNALIFTMIVHQDNQDDLCSLRFLVQNCGTASRR